MTLIHADCKSLHGRILRYVRALQYCNLKAPSIGENMIIACDLVSLHVLYVLDPIVNHIHLHLKHLSLGISHLLTQVTQPPSQMKEQLYLYENFTDQSSGYSAVKNVKKLVKHLERIQGQYNIAEDEVSYQNIEDVSMKVLYTVKNGSLL